jgi:hypothetical protein
MDETEAKRRGRAPTAFTAELKLKAIEAVKANTALPFGLPVLKRFIDDTGLIHFVENQKVEGKKGRAGTHLEVTKEGHQWLFQNKGKLLAAARRVHTDKANRLESEAKSLLDQADELRKLANLLAGEDETSPPEGDIVQDTRVESTSEAEWEAAKPNSVPESDENPTHDDAAEDNSEDDASDDSVNGSDDDNPKNETQREGEVAA